MSTEYRHTKQVTRMMAGSSHTLAILMSMLRVSLEAAWSMARVCLEYAYTHRTGGQTPCAEVCLETKNLFPYWEQNIPRLGIKRASGSSFPYSSCWYWEAPVCGDKKWPMVCIISNTMLELAEFGIYGLL